MPEPIDKIATTHILQLASFGGAKVRYQNIHYAAKFPPIQFCLSAQAKTFGGRFCGTSSIMALPTMTAPKCLPLFLLSVL
jgi:hypothetical protein